MPETKLSLRRMSLARPALNVEQPGRGDHSGLLCSFLLRTSLAMYRRSPRRHMHSGSLQFEASPVLPSYGVNLGSAVG